MTNWNDRNFFEPHYFDDICQALHQRQFLQDDTDVSDTEQVGRWIVDRVDQVLAANSHQSKLPLAAEKAMQAFERATEHFPEQITAHVRDHAGTRAFKGLFSTRHLDIYSMWARIALRTHTTWHSDDSWLHKLACALLRDSDFALKLDEASECCRLGMNRRDTLARIEHHHRALDSSNTSAKSLLMLDLL